MTEQTPEQVPDAFARYIRATFPAEVDVTREIPGRWKHMTGPAERKFWHSIDGRGAWPAGAVNPEAGDVDNAAEIMRLRGALEDIARAAQGHADSTGTIDHNWLVETALRGLGWMPAGEDEGGDVRPREGDPGMKDVTCGSCGEEFGTNFHDDEIECPECEARRCPHCRRWFGGEDGSES